MARKNLKFRRCESASEAVGDHYNICGNWSGDSSYCRFLELLNSLRNKPLCLRHCHRIELSQSSTWELQIRDLYM